MPHARRLLVALSALLLTAAASPQTERVRDRDQMVTNIAQLAAAGAAGRPRRIDSDVLQVMRRVPRHLFVPESQRGRAYSDGALHIGHQATISQPFTVAMMTDLLEVKRSDVVLEVGTGSGYQAAILSGLAREVYSVEIVPELARSAAERLSALGYANVQVRAGDGYAGWPEHAPFDAIIVTAGAPRVPEALVAQLKPGGRLLIPLTVRDGSERLTMVRKDGSGRVRSQALFAVDFIPMIEPRQPRPVAR